MKQAPIQTGRPVQELKGYVATTLTAIHRQPLAATIVAESVPTWAASAPSGLAASGSSQRSTPQAPLLSSQEG